MPDGMVCSPYDVIPRPPTFSARPTITWSRICARVKLRSAGRATTATIASITAPARAKRSATMVNGGMALPAEGSTTTRIAR
ncbi:MAG: hypothetical protein DWI70_01610 [Chloroflexi bacterium]|nr:MAG: hypothetical protein DWI70_01610 [Chloroflexota bacterium]